MMKDAWGEQLAWALLEQRPPMASTGIATRQDLENLAVHLLTSGRSVEDRVGQQQAGGHRAGR